MSDRFSDSAEDTRPLADQVADAPPGRFVPPPRAADEDRAPGLRAADEDRAPGLRADAVSVADRARGSWDAAGNPALLARSPADVPQAADPVDVATADVLLFQDDVSLPGVLPLIVGRAYRSSWRAGRWFGPSWASSFDQHLQIAEDLVVGVFADGRALAWPCRPTEDGPLPSTGLPVTGPRWRLDRVGDGALHGHRPAGRAGAAV